MTFPILLIGLSLICYYSLKRSGYYQRGYMQLQFGSKALLMLFYLCFLGVTICSFGESASEARAFLRWPLIGSILFGVPFLLSIQGESYVDRLLRGMPILIASLTHNSIYVIPVILAAFGGNSSYRPAKSSSTADSYDFDSEIRQQDMQYHQTQEREHLEQDERNARDMGFESADDAKHAGMM